MDSPASKADSELDSTTVFVDFSHLDAVQSEPAPPVGQGEEGTVSPPASDRSTDSITPTVNPSPSTHFYAPVGKILVPGVDPVAVALRRQRNAAGKRIVAFVWRRLNVWWGRQVHRAVGRIQRMWRTNKDQLEHRRLQRFTMQGRIPFPVAHRVLARLLGMRVRRLMSGEKVKQAKCAIAELSAVLSDIPESSRSASDSAFSSSIGHQIEHLKRAVWNVFFEHSSWRRAPPPGYWLVGQNSSARRSRGGASSGGSKISVAHFPTTARRVTTSPRAAAGPSPLQQRVEAVPVTTRKPGDSEAAAMNSTATNDVSSSATAPLTAPSSAVSGGRKGPVALSSLLQQQQQQAINSSHTIRDDAPRATVRPPVAIVDERPLTGNGGGWAPLGAREDVSCSESYHAPPRPAREICGAPGKMHSSYDNTEHRERRGSFDSPGSKAHPTAIKRALKSRPATATDRRPPSGGAGAASNSVDTPTGPYINLVISGASKLMHATRGKIPKDSTGAPIPDRQPSLRVAVSMPKSVGSQDMKKSQYYKFDHPVHTLNPVWNCHMKLPLPTISGCSLFTDQGASEAACRTHFKYWGCGAVMVEVVDIDRFNENIFMGETTILLSSLLGPVRDVCSPLKLTGEFSLQKRLPSDRVSGAVSVDLSVVMNQPVNKSVPRTPPVRRQLHNNSNSGSSGSSSSNPGSANSIQNSQGKKTASGQNHDTTPDCSSSDVHSEALWTSPQSRNIVHGTAGDDDAGKETVPHPVISNKLSKRIGMLKQRKSNTGIDCVAGVAESADRISVPQTTTDPCDSRSEDRVADRKPLYISRSSSGAASFRVAQVTRQLEGLQTALQQDADAALGNMYRRIDEICTPSPCAPQEKQGSQSIRVMAMDLDEGVPQANGSEGAAMESSYENDVDPVYDGTESDSELDADDELIVMSVGHHKKKSSDLDPALIEDLDKLSIEINAAMNGENAIVAQLTTTEKDDEDVGSTVDTGRRWRELGAQRDTIINGGEHVPAEPETVEVEVGLDDSGGDEIVYAPHTSPRYSSGHQFQIKVDSSQELIESSLQVGSEDVVIDDEIEEEYEVISYQGKGKPTGTAFDFSTGKWV